MRTKAVIPLVVGLALGVFAIKLMYDVVQKARANPVAGEMVSVVRAKTEIPMTSRITEPMLEIIQAPKGFLPPGWFGKKEDVIGRVTNVMIPKNMPVAGSMLQPVGSAEGAPSRIPDGFRAVAVKVDESSGVAFLVKPGNRVDVAAVLPVKTANGNETISKTILENVEVLAVGQELGQKGDKGTITIKSVTLLVKPDDVPRLHLAAEKGKIRLAMRNQIDADTIPVRGMTDAELFGSAPPTQPAQAGPKKQGLFTKMFAPKTSTPVMTLSTPPMSSEWTVQVIRGDKESVVKFADANSTQKVASERRPAGPAATPVSTMPPARLRGGTGPIPKFPATESKSSPQSLDSDEPEADTEGRPTDRESTDTEASEFEL